MSGGAGSPPSEGFTATAKHCTGTAPTLCQLKLVRGQPWTSTTRREGPVSVNARKHEACDRPRPQCTTPSKSPVWRASFRTAVPDGFWSVEPVYEPALRAPCTVTTSPADPARVTRWPLGSRENVALDWGTTSYAGTGPSNWITKRSKPLCAPARTSVMPVGGLVGPVPDCVPQRN